MIYTGSCPKCHGTMALTDDFGETVIKCLNCSWTIDQRVAVLLLDRFKADTAA